jgi:hypothetical protein
MGHTIMGHACILRVLAFRERFLECIDLRKMEQLLLKNGKTFSFIARIFGI